MKRLLLLLSTLIASSSFSALRSATLTSPGAENAATTLVAEGFVAGFCVTLCIDGLRASLPSADSLQLHPRYGICRDQLTGQIKALIAVIITAAKNPQGSSWHWRAVTLRALGILTGICAAAYTEKLLVH